MSFLECILTQIVLNKFQEIFKGPEQWKVFS